MCHKHGLHVLIVMVFYDACFGFAIPLIVSKHVPLVRNNMAVNENERLSTFIPKHTSKYTNRAFTTIVRFIATVIYGLQ